MESGIEFCGKALPECVEPVLGLRDGQASLAAWYGDPLPVDEAECLYGDTQSRLRSGLCAGRPVGQLLLLQLLCRNWMGFPVALEFAQLAASATDRRYRALLELVYGQLLMSCKRRPALQHLGTGFSLASDYLDASEYFLLVRRHELLGYIPLTDERLEPRGLQALLAEAGVIMRLRGERRREYREPHLDTLG